MVDLTKRRVSAEAAKNGQWFEDPPGFRGIAVKITALDTDACVAVRQKIVQQMFGEEAVDADKYPGLTEYIASRVIMEAAVKDIRGLTNDGGKPVDYSPNYLAGILLTDQAADAKPKTPDGKAFDPGAKAIYEMLLSLGHHAGRVREGEEKKQPPASFAGAGGSPSTSGTGEAKAAEEATPSGSTKAKAKN